LKKLQNWIRIMGAHGSVLEIFIIVKGNSKKPLILITELSDLF
jgi:hypothetical protein